MLEIHRVVGTVSGLRVERWIAATAIICRIEVGAVELRLLKPLVDLIVQEAQPEVEA